MQRCNERMALNITRMFRASTISGGMGFSNNDLMGYERGNVWQSFIRIDSSDKQNVKAPLFLLGSSYIMRAMARFEEVIVPTNYFDAPSDFITTLRSGDAIVKYFALYSQSYSYMFGRVDTNKNETYYGCPGIILNKDRKPLFMVVAEYSIEEQVCFKDCKVYIHPSVFYIDGLVEKCIANKILPYILSHPIHPYMEGAAYLIPRGGVIPEVIVKDVTNEFFCNTIIPNDVPSKEELDQLLLNHIDEVDNVTWNH